MSMTILVLFAIFCKAVPAAGSSNVLHRRLFSSLRPSYVTAANLFECRSCPASPNSNYTVLANNTCQTIAEAYSVSTDYIIALNCLDPTGSDLKANTSM